MTSIAEWRGKPDVTQYSDALQIFDLAKLSKTDVFYDLGCGYGQVCIWAARRCKFAKGIESHAGIVRQAEKNVQKSGLKNVKIVKADFFKYRFSDADVLYSVTRLDVNDFRMWNRRKRKKSLRIVTIGPPPVPIKPVENKGAFSLTRFPFKLAKTREEWYYAVLGERTASWKDVVRKYKRAISKEALRSLKKEFSQVFNH